MDSLIETFHIDVKLLLAQVINFVIVFSVLYFFALKPLLKVMTKRTEKIEKSLKDAEKIDEKMKNTEKECEKNLVKAKKEASVILKKADELAKVNKQEMIDKGREELSKVIEQEKVKLQQEKAKTLKEIKTEVADLVVVSMEKVLEEKLDGKKDEDLIKKVVKNLK